MCTQEGWLEYFLMLIMRKVVPPDKPKNSQSHERANFKQGVRKNRMRAAFLPMARVSLKADLIKWKYDA